ncbi:MAG: hypothetical protein ETSY2_13265 [Candidatus Entotheonella gemina]|uniref:DUF7660 domain-containing protein n=1 Tax=Candidatus Entotheonella gemina TaxID=1429439 RepID=W4MBQ3_9BACT|nr:MAG: hypothetical protein ETSY2_13265 [Candidatus Entotheonella gemina]
MNLIEQVQKIQTRDEFVIFVHHLLQDLHERPEQWKNASLEAYLEAVASWVQDMDGYYRNRGEKAPKHLTWQHLGEILLAAKIYE